MNKMFTLAMLMLFCVTFRRCSKLNNKRNVYLMYAIVFLQGFVFYGPVATLFRQARGLSVSEIFFIESISWIVMLLLEIPWGWFADRFGYKKTLVLANTLFFVSKIVFYAGHSFEMFLFERVLLSIVISGLSGCDSALIYESIESKESQKVFGYYSACATSGYILAALLSSLIVKISLDATALFTIIPYALAAILTFFLVDMSKGNSQPSKITKCLKDALTNRELVIFVVGIALIMEVFQATTVFLNQIKYEEVGLSPVYFGFIVAVIQGVRLIAAKSHVLTKKWGNAVTLNGGIVLIVLSCILLMTTHSKIISVISVALIATSAALIGPVEQAIKNKAIDGDRATYLSIYSMIGGIVAAVMNLIIGRVSEHSIQLGFGVCILVGITGFLLVWWYSINSKKCVVEVTR